MSAKTQVQEYAANAEGPFTTRDVTEALGLNISTVRSAIRALIEERVLVRGEDNTVEQRKVITRTHSKPKISDILTPKFEAALEGVNIVIPADADADTKRDMKAAIRTALSIVTYGNTVAEVTSCKGFSKYSESHLDWYKSQYLRKRRAELTAATADESTPAVEAA